MHILHVPIKNPKSALGRLTTGESAVFADGFAQIEEGGLLFPQFKKIECRGYDHGRGSWLDGQCCPLCQPIFAKSEMQILFKKSHIFKVFSKYLMQ